MRKKTKTMNREASARFPDGFRILHGRQEYISYVEHSSIRIWTSVVAAHYDNHVHSAVEIIMPKQGVSVYRLPDHEYHVQPGEILIVPSGCPHELSEPPEIVRYLFLFEPSLLTALRDLSGITDLIGNPIYLHDDPELQNQASELLTRTASCYFEHQPLWNTQCYAWLLQLYVLLGRHYLAQKSPQATSDEPGIDAEIMNSAITYINEHYMHNITLEEIAAFAGFSKYYFSRTFKQFSGASYTAFLAHKRLSVAADLLVHSGKPIHEIAKLAGFGSAASFNRHFLAQKNCTPTQYRAIYGAGMKGIADPSDNR